jgi:hypothetical protein
MRLDYQMMKKITIVFGTVTLAGCASSHVQLQVNTQPPGAYITEASGTVHGISPVVTRYPRDALRKHGDGRGCVLVAGFKAQWVSGATGQILPTVRLCGPSEIFETTIVRDTDAPGLEKDLEFALRISTAGAAQRQAGAAEDAAMFQFLNLVKPGR